jgi:hypothetical protein
MPTDLKRMADRGAKIWSSAPVELLALSAARALAAAPALSAAIDRGAIQNVIFQRQGEPAGGLLPNWVSGYAALFPTAVDLLTARRLVTGLPLSARTLTISVDPGDVLGRVIAERVAVNARDAGLPVQIAAPGVAAELRLVRVRLQSLDPAAALTEAANALGLDTPALNEDLETVFKAENSLLAANRVIPLVYLPRIYAASPRVRNWLVPPLSRTGEIGFSDLWIAP